jgi:hypothetical protein
MTIQTIQIGGERYVLLLERDFLALQRHPRTEAAESPSPQVNGPRFREVTPLPVEGTPASEILLRDRR